MGSHQLTNRRDVELAPVVIHVRYVWETSLWESRRDLARAREIENETFAVIARRFHKHKEILETGHAKPLLKVVDNSRRSVSQKLG
jgi:hypothetical protein